MPNSLARLSLGAESSTISDWRAFYSSSQSRRLAVTQSLRDPLRSCTFRTEEIVAVFGYFLEEDGASLVYFWSERLRSLSLHKITGSDCSLLLQVGAVLGDICRSNPNMHVVRNLCSQRSLFERVDTVSRLDGLGIYWVELAEMRFAGLYRSGPVVEGVSAEHSSSAALSECLSFHYDYFRLKSPIWHAAPMRYLFRNSSLKIDSLIKLHLQPRYYLPEANRNSSEFRWPWQECITYDFNCCEYKAIDTTSFVMDLRKSTVAMEQLKGRNLGRYSPFINNIVRTAKSIVFRHGGFFDKETGDGIVAHFVPFESLGRSDIKPASKRAFDAAVEVIRACSRICAQLQGDLNFGVGGLGAAIGIHTGESIWVAEENQIRAIGESVIFASRLCAEAEVKSVFVSRSQFGIFGKSVEAEVLSKFERREYRGKEVEKSASLYGYHIVIRDDI
jgi:class 3 adenylate cyclase